MAIERQSFELVRGLWRSMHEQQRGDGADHHAADDGAREDCILLFTGAADRHRKHSDDHCSRCHQHGPQTRRASG
jgi:hypothetical protein